MSSFNLQDVDGMALDLPEIVCFCEGLFILCNLWRYQHIYESVLHNTILVGVLGQQLYYQIGLFRLLPGVHSIHGMTT